jgi:hypothetical protein
MSGLRDFVAQHDIWDTIILFWIISAAINGLPEPDDHSSAFYRWFYVFATTIVGHLHDAMNRHSLRAPESRTRS